MESFRRRLTTIRFKAVGVVFALTIALVAFLSTYFPARQIESVRGAMRDKAATYASLIAKQVEPGVAFDDRETVREVFAAAAADPDLRRMTLYDERGRTLVAWGQAGGAAAPLSSHTTAVEVVSEPAFVRATAPVVSREGPRGTLVVELSTSRVESDRRGIQRTALLVGLGALTIGFAVAWVIGSSLARRIGAIADATRQVASGDLTDRPIDDSSADEVGQLARSFHAMSVNIRALVAQIRETGARENERLDGLVRTRTAELDARNDDLRLVLDNVNQGLLVVERNGCMASERSAMVARWFGDAGEGVTFWDYIGRHDERAAATFRLNWEALLEGTMPQELSLDQLPHGMRMNDREFELDYTPLLEGTATERVLVVVSDVTRRRAAERAEAEQREMVAVFERIASDPAGFLEFVDEATSLVRELCADERAPRVDILRWLHTLKGNASVYGMNALASFCHSLEDSMAEADTDLFPAQRQALLAHWDGFAGRVAGLLGERRDPRIDIDDVEYDSLLRALLEGRPRQEITWAVATWRLESVSVRLARHAAQARALAKRAGKGTIEVTVDAGRLRLSREVLAHFWGVFVHVLRNAVAHGLEPPAERAAAGKVPAGSIRMRAWRASGRVMVTVADDGRGVDWAAVARGATAAGLPCSTPAELQEALFSHGLSTTQRVDAVSGRGVGMGAVRAECEKLGGQVSVESVAGQGTTVRFSFPAEVVLENDETRRARSAETKRGWETQGAEPIEPAEAGV